MTRDNSSTRSADKVLFRFVHSFIFLIFGCKSTKKNPNTQIFGVKNGIFIKMCLCLGKLEFVLLLPRIAATNNRLIEIPALFV